MDAKGRAELLRIARSAITAAIKGDETPSLEGIDESFKAIRAVFVTLNIADNLRGCIGQMIAREELWKAVQNMAVSASLHDPRFQPLTLAELENVTIEISVLTPLQKVESYEDIILGRDGVLLRKGINSGVYLPQVAVETGWDLDTFLGSLCAHKAGLNWTAYKNEDIDIFTFQVEKFKEKQENL